MKKLTLLFAVLMAAGITFAQGDRAQRPSPAAKAQKEMAGVNIAIDYSQPSVKGRTIWGVLVPYEKVWRTGANEATVFSVSKDVLVEGQKLPAGTYSLFSIPGQEEWTIIFNKEAKQWGAYNYDEKKDALRIEVKPQPSEAFTERMTFDIREGEENGALVNLSWEKVSVGFAVQPAE